MEGQEADVSLSDSAKPKQEILHVIYRVLFRDFSLAHCDNVFLRQRYPLRKKIDPFCNVVTSSFVLCNQFEQTKIYRCRLE